MTDAATTTDAAADLDRLRHEAATWTNCELHAPATQTVFGQGPPTAWLVLVGEQPVKHFRPDGGVADARQLARFFD